MRKMLAVLMIAGLTACEGPAGPMGPEGPQGLPGPGATQIVLSGTFSTSAGADVDLPAAAGSSVANLPAITVYHGADASGPFLTIADGTSTVASSTTFYGVADVGDHLQVRIRNVVAGWSYWVVVTY